MKATLKARWIFPVTSPPIPHGTITVVEGLIEAVNGPGPCDLDLGNVAILPGFVNAHTHLDLSGMRGRCPPSADFTGWLRQVVAQRRQRSLDEVQRDIQAGCMECLRFGTTLIGDISAFGWSRATLSAMPIRSVVFHELLGLTQQRADDAWQAAQSWLATQHDSPHCRSGLSPHAPYSVRTALQRKCAQLEVPLAMHLAESRAELELLARRTGPFVDFLKDLGVWDPTGLAGSPEEVMAILGERAIYVHANYLDPKSATGKNIVYCPRTHAAFGHDKYPLMAFLKHGVRVALGTDSLASNPDLDILAEARFVRKLFPEVSGANLLRMLTWNGAQMLGFAAGSLAPGTLADLVTLPVSDDYLGDPHDLIFETTSDARVLTIGGIRYEHVPPVAHAPGSP